RLHLGELTPVFDNTTAVVTASPTRAPADGTTPATITVTVKDNFGSPRIGIPVTLSVNGGATITQQTGTTNAAGVAQGTITDATRELVTVSVTVDGVLSGSVNVRFVGSDKALDLSVPSQAGYAGAITYTLVVRNNGL